ncbi:hypothetical protein Tco_0855830 [Tanacetum coccineum]
MTPTTSMKIDSNADVAFTDTKQKVTGIKDVEDLQVRIEKLEEIFSYLRNRNLKQKEVILGTDDETSSKDDTSSNDEISSSEYLINYLSARDVEWQLPKNTQEEPPKPHYDPIKTEVEENHYDFECVHIHMLLQVLWVPIELHPTHDLIVCSSNVSRPVEGNAVARRVIDDLVDISGKTSVDGYMRFFKAQQVAETSLVAEIESFYHPGEVFDTLMGLRDDIRVEEAKLAGLNDLITQAEEEIKMKEAQLECYECLDEFPADDEMFLEIDEVVFKIHTKGYFEYDPLRLTVVLVMRRDGDSGYKKAIEAEIMEGKSVKVESE